jgi:hypothetical protein
LRASALEKSTVVLDLFTEQGHLLVTESKSFPELSDQTSALFKSSVEFGCMARKVSAGIGASFGLISIYLTSTCALQQPLLVHMALSIQSQVSSIPRSSQFLSRLLLDLGMDGFLLGELLDEFIVCLLGGLLVGVPLELHEGSPASVALLVPVPGDRCQDAGTHYTKQQNSSDGPQQERTQHDQMPLFLSKFDWCSSCSRRSRRSWKYRFTEKPRIATINPMTAMLWLLVIQPNSEVVAPPPIAVVAADETTVSTAVSTAAFVECIDQTSVAAVVRGFWEGLPLERESYGIPRRSPGFPAS